MVELVNPIKKKKKALVNPLAPPPKIDRSAKDVALDTVAGLGQGVAHVVKGVGSLYGQATGNMDNALLRKANRNIDFYSGLESEGMKEAQRRYQQRIDEADSTVGKFYEGAKGILTDPRMLQKTVTELAPMMTGIGAVGRGAGIASKAIGAGKKVQQAAGTGAAITAGAGLHSGSVGSETYERMMSQPRENWSQNIDYLNRIASGATPEQAKHDIALGASRRATAESAAVSGAVNLLPGARVLERALAGGKTAGGRVVNTLKGAGGEAVSEAVEEGHGQFAANRGVRLVDPRQQLSEGVAESAGMGAAAGGLFGGAAGFLSAGQQEKATTTNDPTQKPLLALPPPQQKLEHKPQYVDQHGRPVNQPGQQLDPGIVDLVRPEGIGRASVDLNKPPEPLQLTHQPQYVDQHGRPVDHPGQQIDPQITESVRPEGVGRAPIELIKPESEKKQPALLPPPADFHVDSRGKAQKPGSFSNDPPTGKISEKVRQEGIGTTDTGVQKPKRALDDQRKERAEPTVPEGQPVDRTTEQAVTPPESGDKRPAETDQAPAGADQQTERKTEKTKHDIGTPEGLLAHAVSESGSLGKARNYIRGVNQVNQKMGKPAVKVDDKKLEAAFTKAKTEEIDAAANEAATSDLNDLPKPTEAQKESGNYKVGKTKLHGMDISIENPKGSIREGRDAAGKHWQTVMKNHYGYVKGSEAVDGDHVDVFLTDNASDEKRPVFVVDQVDPKTGKYDEPKTIIGAANEKEARKAYLSNYDKGWKGLGAITEMSMDDFKTWVKSDKAKQPVALGKTLPDTKIKEEQPVDKAAELAETVATESTEKIEDFGNKIGGARKDLAGVYTDTLTTDIDIANESLTKSFPEPDYEKHEAEGADKKGLAFISLLRGQIPSKPRVLYKKQQWVNQVSGLRSLAAKVASGEVPVDRISKLLDDPKYKTLRGMKDMMDVYAELPTNQFKAVSKNQWSITHARRRNPETGQYDKDVYYLTGKKRIRGASEATEAGTMEEAKKKAVDFLSNWAQEQAGSKGKRKEAPIDLRIYRDRETGDRFIGYKSPGGLFRVKEGFKSLSEANQYRNENINDLENAVREKRKGPDVRNPENEMRTGPSRRKGDVNPEAFQKSFGFYGVEFGNYVEGNRRQKDLNNAHDALTDLAEATNIPTEALSLNGSMGLAFGARGRGGKRAPAAHYESGKIAINLTKRSGPGSLAHEWLHGLDNYFARIDRGLKGRKPSAYFATNQAKRSIPPELMRKEVYDAWKNLVTTIHNSDLAKRSKELDAGRSKAYFGTTIEMAARAFEGYIKDNLQAKGIKNDYLANINESSGAYPTAEELDGGMREAFDNLFKTLKTKKTETGVALFSRKTGKGSGKDGKESIYSINEREPNKVSSGQDGDNAKAPNTFDLFSTAAISSKQAYGSAREVFRVKHVQTPVGKIKSGLDTVHTAGEAAHVLAPFRRHSQETMVALVTDKAGKIVNLIRHTKGQKDQSSVSISELLGAVANTEGAANVWFGHNHPSNSSNSSSPDNFITERLIQALDGSGIEYKGHIILRQGQVATAIANGTDVPVQIKPLPRKRDIEITERVIRKRKSGNTKVKNTKDVISVFNQIPADHVLMFTDTTMSPIGIVEMTPAEIGDLKPNNQIKRLFQSIDKTNAKFAFLKSTSDTEWQNLARFLNSVGVNLLDAIIDGKGYSDGEKKNTQNIKGIYFSTRSSYSKSEYGKVGLAVDPDQSAVTTLNKILAKQYGEDWNNAFEAVKPTQKDQQSDDFVGVRRAIKSAFGAEVVTVRAREKEKDFFNGVYLPRAGRGNTIFVNARSDVDFVQVAGHELLHSIRHNRPDLYNWFRKESYKHIDKLGAYQSSLNKRLIPGDKQYSARDAQEEMLADFTGDALADPKFVRQLAKDNPGKFKQLANSILRWISRVIGKLDPMLDKQYIKNMDQMRSNLRHVLNLYAEGKQIPQSEGEVDLKFSRKKRAPNESVGFAVPDETLKTVTIRKLQDKFKVLKDLQGNIADAGGNIDEKSDAYLAEELFHGKAENDIRQMRETYVEPLAEKMASYGIDQAELDEYLYALHAPERNAHIATINPKMPDGGSGMTNAEAAKVIQKVKDTGKLGHYDELAGVVYDMLHNQRDLIREAGLEDDGMIDAWEAKYKNYVPLKGYAEDEKQSGMPGTGQGFNIGGKESKRALGRGSKAASPSSYALNDLTEKLIRKRKNEVGNAFLNLVEANPNPDYWEVFTDDNPEVDRRIVKNKDGEQVKETVVPMAMMRDKYFTTKRDGKIHYIKLKDERLMKAMKNIGPESNNALIRGMSAYVRVLSSLNTSYNPEFVVSNFLRDIQTAGLNLSAEQTRDDGKIKGEAIVKQTVRDVPKAMRAVFRIFRQKDGGEWGKIFEQFMEDGGKTGWFDMKDIDGQAKQLESMIRMAKGGAVGNSMKYFKNGAQFVEHLNGAVENAVRLSAYKNAIDAGVSRKKAASLAKNMTVNFNRRGEVGTMMNALYMFANASVQGTANFARTMIGFNGDKSPRWRNMNRAQKAAVGIMGGAYALAMANRMAAGDDDDGENWYSKVPDYVKERNIVIMKSLVGGEQDGTFYKIPLPYGYNVFSVMATSLEGMINGDKSIPEAGADLMLATLGSFSPIGFSDSDSATGILLKNATPTIAKPLVDVAMNENFFGGEIYQQNFPFGLQKPDSQLARRSTPEHYKRLANWLNESTGGSRFRSGAIDVNPDVARYFVDNFLGGAGAFWGDKVPDSTHRMVTGIGNEVHQIPFLGRVNGKVLPWKDQSTFYDRRKLIEQAHHELKSLKGVERKEYAAEYGWQAKLRPAMKESEKALKALRKKRDAIYASEKLSAKERDMRLKSVQTQMKSVIDRFNKRYTTVESTAK